MSSLLNVVWVAELLANRFREAAERKERMKDATLIRICEETTKWLSQTITVNPASQMVPSYNALLEAAKGNHPDHFFLRALQLLPVSGDELVTIGEMIALFGQIRIVLESLREMP